jgi:hypothetical protein
MSLVFVAGGIVAFLSASTLAIDLGMLMTARAQAQNAADAGALGGATALVFNSFTDRTPSGPVVRSAISAAQTNPVIGVAPSVLTADVTFPNDPSGQPTRVKVNVFRTTARGNPVPTFMARLFGISTANIVATATAEAQFANAETCVAPFTVPDKWKENSDSAGKPDGPWTPSSTFDMYDSKGKLLPNPDVYTFGVTSFDPTLDKGLQLVLKENNTGKVAPSLYNPWDLPGSMGGNDYRNNIDTCNTNIIKIGDFMPPENGNMVGPTVQGVNALLAAYPDAMWATSTNCPTGCPTGNAGDISRRTMRVPLYNPVVYAQGQQSGKNAQLQVVNYLGFFIEGMQGQDVVGRIWPITGYQAGTGGPIPPGTFPKTIRLVQ